MSGTPKPFLPYGRQRITETDIASVVEVLRSPYLTQGPTVPAFERAVPAKEGTRQGVADNTATSALHIACLALGLGPEVTFGRRRSHCGLSQLRSLLRCRREFR